MTTDTVNLIINTQLQQFVEFVRMYPTNTPLQAFHMAFGTHCVVALKQAVSEAQWNPEVFPGLNEEVNP